MINGPHCPKCDFSNCWVWYSGEDLNNPDALRCEAGTGIPGRECGYIYWRRNAPREWLPPADAENQRLMVEPPHRGMTTLRALQEKRARVRALVHSMLNSDMVTLRDKSAAYLVLIAKELDDCIEALNLNDDRDSASGRETPL